jgi:hypothetical protein
MSSLTNTPCDAIAICAQSSQPELFEELASGANPRSDFAEFRVGEKIIPVPFSIWSDGRMRANLKKYGAGLPVAPNHLFPVSRNRYNLIQKIIGVLEMSFGRAIEAIEEELAREQSSPARPRQTNKHPTANQPIASPIRYINPFCQKWTFGRCPDWLLARREPSAIEKHVYGKFLYPLGVCDRWDEDRGIIFGLNQVKLARALGIKRQSANEAITALRRRGLIECVGGRGARQVIRFLWHEWMPETCPFNGQVSEGVYKENNSNNSSAEAIVEIYQKLYPQHDVRAEFKRYQRHRQKLARPLTEETFADWMRRAQLVITPLKPKLSGPVNEAGYEAGHAGDDDVDPLALAQFLEKFEAHKAKKSAIAAKCRAQPSEHEE